MKLAGVIFWFLLAGGLLLVLYGAALLRRVRRFGLGPGRPLELGGGAIAIRYPHWWTCQLESPERARLITHDHDGELVLSCATRPDPPADPVQALRDYLSQQPLRLDEPLPTPHSGGPAPGALLVSTATVVNPLDPNEQQRANLIYYLFEGRSTRLLLAYRCSVLYGLVDGYYLDRMVQTLRMDGRSSASGSAGAPA